MLNWNDAPKFGRSESLKLVLETLHAFKKEGVIIVETGTTRGSLGGGIVGDGWATLAFGWFCKKYGGEVYTIDILEEAINECKTITASYAEVINYIVGDAAEFLKTFDKTIDLLYLDSADDPNVIQSELIAASNKMTMRSIVVIDDTHENLTVGKGTIAGNFLLSRGWILFREMEGQVIFVRSNMVPLLMKETVYKSYYEFRQKTAEGIKLELSIDDYDAPAKIWHKILRTNLPTKEELPEIDGKVRVLDVGCHTGYNTKLFEEMYGYAEGIDINSNLINASRLNHDKCKEMSCDNLLYDNSTFSLVVAKDVYEHCLNPTKAFEEAYRVLGNNGVILVIIPLDGEIKDGLDDITIHPAFYYNNLCHTWKATQRGVMNRLFDVGFTDFTSVIVKHSDLFGSERQYGDKVIIAKAKKVEGIKKVPIQWLFGNAYWAAFVTMDCTSNCHYCIQNMSKEEMLRAKGDYRKTILKPQEWIDFYNSLQKHQKNTLSIVGGEPTMYDGFYEVVNGIRGYYKTITTNLKSRYVDDINSFIANIEDKKSVRINTSFHPKLISIDEFCNKVHILRNAGFFVDQVAMVDYPLSNFKYYYDEFLTRGIALSPQTYLGKMNDMLLPIPGSDVSPNYNEHGIVDYDMYQFGFSCNEKRDVLCRTNRFLVSPNGSIHRCHYHLYSNRGAVANVKDESLPILSDYIGCSDFGFCNPCDFPHANFKPIHVNLNQEILKIVKEPEFVNFITNYIRANKDEVIDLINSVAEILYRSNDPYWELYNNDMLKSTINKFINADGVINNHNAFLLAQLDTLLFCGLPHGVNIYRILDRPAQLKYVDALGYIIYMRLVEDGVEIKNLLLAPELVKGLDNAVAMLETTLGLAPILADKLVFTVGEKYE